MGSARPGPPSPPATGYDLMDPVSTRLSTFRSGQRIVLPEHGEIAERGTHEELLEAEGR